MYNDCHGLTASPFPPAPDPARYWPSLSHRRALSCLAAGLRRGEGFMVITGEPGTGKTMLVAHALATIRWERLTTALVAGTTLDAGQTIPAIAGAFGLPPDVAPGHGSAGDSFVLDAFLCFLRDQSRAGRRCLLVVEEAQTLPIVALEALRLLGDFRLGARPLLQILLAGTPEFAARLQAHDDLEHMRQRVVAAHHLEPLAATEVEHYLRHRLGCLGSNGHAVDPLVSAGLYAATGGVPQRIDRIVDDMVTMGAFEPQPRIDGAMLLRELRQAGEGGRGGDTGQVGAGKVCPDQVDRVLCTTSAEMPRMDALLDRLASLESRVARQEQTIHQTLTMLIGWIEQRDAVPVKD